MSMRTYIINKTKVLIAQKKQTLDDFGYPVYALMGLFLPKHLNTNLCIMRTICWSYSYVHIYFRKTIYISKVKVILRNLNERVRFMELINQNGKVLWTSLTTICS